MGVDCDFVVDTVRKVFKLVCFREVFQLGLVIIRISQNVAMIQQLVTAMSTCKVGAYRWQTVTACFDTAQCLSITVMPILLRPEFFTRCNQKPIFKNSEAFSP